MTDTIFKPRFDQTQLESLINAISNNAWLVERMLLMPKHELWFKRDVQIARAAATTQIEGASLSEEDVSALVKEVQAGRLTEDEQANLNAIAAYDFVDYLSDQRDIPVDELAIRELNRQFLRGASEALTPGSYRRGQNKVGTRYDPPNQGDVPALMKDFVVWLNAHDEIDAVIKAALAHLQFVAIHPFWDGNGRTARALATLILQRSSRHSFRKLLSLEQSFAQTRDEYFTAIERSLGSAYRSDYDAMPFLEFFATALTAHSILLTQRLTEWHRSMEHVQAAFSAVDINHRQAEALAYATKASRLTRSDYLEITRTSPVTASRDLADLVAKGWLKPEGRTRGRVYRMVQRQESTGQRAIEERVDQPRLFGKNT
jgi:Fic family protein